MIVFLSQNYNIFYYHNILSLSIITNQFKIFKYFYNLESTGFKSEHTDHILMTGHIEFLKFYFAEINESRPFTLTEFNMFLQDTPSYRGDLYEIVKKKTVSAESLMYMYENSNFVGHYTLTEKSLQYRLNSHYREYSSFHNVGIFPVESIQYLIKISKRAFVPKNNFVLKYAIGNKMLEYLLSIGYNIDEPVSKLFVKDDRIRNFEFLFDNGYYDNIDVWSLIIKNKSIKCMKYHYEKTHPDPETIRKIITELHNFIKFYYDEELDLDKESYSWIKLYISPKDDFCLGSLVLKGLI